MNRQSIAEAIEKHLMQEALEEELDRPQMIQMLSPRRLMKEVDRELKYWGYTYHSEVIKEYNRSTGIKAVMGNILKRHMKQDEVNNKAPIFYGTSERFERINTAVNKMTPVYKQKIHEHYVINERRDSYRNGMKTYDYAKLINIPLTTYNNHLREAKQLFIAMGGIK